MKVLVLAVLLFASQAAFSYTFDSDVPESIQKQMVDDLAFMATLQGSKVTPLHQQIFGEMSGSGYKNWFESRVTAIGLDDCGNPNAVACVAPFRGPSRMWLTPNFIKFSHPQIARMMVVYHEARHTEIKNQFWSHATCPTPFKNANGEDVKSIWTGAMLAGQPACDITPFGSYGSSTILLKNVSKFCANCSEKVKMDAGIYSDDQLGRITSTEAKSKMVEDFKTN